MAVQNYFTAHGHITLLNVLIKLHIPVGNGSMSCKCLIGFNRLELLPLIRRVYLVSLFRMPHGVFLFKYSLVVRGSNRVLLT